MINLFIFQESSMYETIYLYQSYFEDQPGFLFD